MDLSIGRLHQSSKKIKVPELSQGYGNRQEGADVRDFIERGEQRKEESGYYLKEGLFHEGKRI